VFAFPGEKPASVGKKKSPGKRHLIEVLFQLWKEWLHLTYNPAIARIDFYRRFVGKSCFKNPRSHFKADPAGEAPEAIEEINIEHGLHMGLRNLINRSPEGVLFPKYMRLTTFIENVLKNRIDCDEFPMFQKHIGKSKNPEKYYDLGSGDGDDDEGDDDDGDDGGDDGKGEAKSEKGKKSKMRDLLKSLDQELPTVKLANKLLSTDPKVVDVKVLCRLVEKGYAEVSIKAGFFNYAAGVLAGTEYDPILEQTLSELGIESADHFEELKNSITPAKRSLDHAGEGEQVRSSKRQKVMADESESEDSSSGSENNLKSKLFSPVAGEESKVENSDDNDDDNPDSGSDDDSDVGEKKKASGDVEGGSDDEDDDEDDNDVGEKKMASVHVEGGSDDEDDDEDDNDSSDSSSKEKKSVGNKRSGSCKPSKPKPGKKDDDDNDGETGPEGGSSDHRTSTKGSTGVSPRQSQRIKQKANQNKDVSDSLEVEMTDGFGKDCERNPDWTRKLPKEGSDIRKSIFAKAGNDSPTGVCDGELNDGASVDDYESNFDWMMKLPPTGGTDWSSNKVYLSFVSGASDDKFLDRSYSLLEAAQDIAEGEEEDVVRGSYYHVSEGKKLIFD